MDSIYRFISSLALSQAVLGVGPLSTFFFTNQNGNKQTTDCYMYLKTITTIAR